MTTTELARQILKILHRKITFFLTSNYFSFDTGLFFTTITGQFETANMESIKNNFFSISSKISITCNLKWINWEILF